MSFDPIWSTILVMEVGSEGKKFRSLSRMTGIVALGKHCVMALMKWMSLVMDTLMIDVVGWMRGRGG